MFLVCLLMRTRRGVSFVQADVAMDCVGTDAGDDFRWLNYAKLSQACEAN